MIRFGILRGMKKYIFSLLLVPILFITLATSSQAAIIDDTISNLKNIGGRPDILINVSDDPGAGIAGIAGAIIYVVLSVLGIIFLALTVYGGWLWMTAAGNQERVSKAKDLLRDAVIGIAIVFTAFAITRFVIDGILSASEGSTTLTL